MSATRQATVMPLTEVNGAELRLTLRRADGSKVSVTLGAAEAIAVAGDLIAGPPGFGWAGRDGR